MSTASYASSCTNVVICNKPTSTSDARGNTTDYTYDATHGGVLTVTYLTRADYEETASLETDPGEPAFRHAARGVRASSAWRYFEIPTNHMMASNKPEETARLLERVAQGA